MRSEDVIGENCREGVECEWSVSINKNDGEERVSETRIVGGRYRRRGRDRADVYHR